MSDCGGKAVGREAKGVSGYLDGIPLKQPKPPTTLLALGRTREDQKIIEVVVVNHRRTLVTGDEHQLWRFACTPNFRVSLNGCLQL